MYIVIYGCFRNAIGLVTLFITANVIRFATYMYDEKHSTLILKGFVHKVSSFEKIS